MYTVLASVILIFVKHGVLMTEVDRGHDTHLAKAHSRIKVIMFGGIKYGSADTPISRIPRTTTAAVIPLGPELFLHVSHLALNLFYVEYQIFKFFLI